ncbi:hypothetical protein QBC44DRAFT_231822 [Cladorrhinum sp. PSN332]|nr:hypothetical protein QBC44DRAFT_231822 [Cladorrhinum sp. PSN332]
MAYYENQQWPPSGPASSGWDHQTPPPARSGTSSVIPPGEPSAFFHQIEEVDRAIDNLTKSGKMFGAPGGGRREFSPFPGPANMYPGFDGRTQGAGSGGPPRPHSMADFGGDVRSGGGPHHQGTNLQNFYANQRHQPSRGSNEAEQMMQAKRRFAAQRERELRNYHQEQQYNRNVSDVGQYNKPDRTLSPGSLSEEERRKLIAQQRTALYEGGYLDEAGNTRSGLPPPSGPSSMRGPSPLAYEYGRVPPLHTDTGSQGPVEAGQQGPQSAGAIERSRANSNSSPQSNPTGSKGVFDSPSGQQPTRTSASSPGGSPPRQGVLGSKAGQGSVAPIGTRPSGNNTPTNPALNKRSTTPLPSPLSQGYTATGNDENAPHKNAGPANAGSTTTGEATNVGLSGWPARPGGGWGNKPGLGVQASVWG